MIPFRANRRGLALALSLTVLAVLTGMAGYFSLNIGLELQAARSSLAGVQAEALAEAGLARTISKIRSDVRLMKYMALDPGGDDTNSLVDQRYSTRAIFNEGIQDENGSGDEDRRIKLDGTEASDAEDGYYVIVRDLNAGVDLNLYDANGLDPDFSIGSWSNPDRPLAFLLETFPSISDARASQIASSVNALPGNPGEKLRAREQLRSIIRPLVADEDSFENVYEEIYDHVTTKTSPTVVSGGLVARYFGVDTSGSEPVIQFDQYKGMTIERGNPYGTPKKFTEHTFRLGSASDFFFDGTVLTNDADVPVSQQTFSAGEAFAVIWTGFIFIPNETPISFRVNYTGGIRLKIADVDLTGAAHWGTGGAGVFEGTFSLPAGWQPIVFEYGHAGGVPAVAVFWSGGFHHIDPGTGKNIAADDPDVQMSFEQQYLPMGSLGFKAGGIYHIVSSGSARNAAGSELAVRTVEAEVRIWDIMHESSVQDFTRGGLLRAHYEDDCPVLPIGHFEKNWNSEFDRGGAHGRTYDTVYNAIKTGYWENFEDAFGEPGLYPFANPDASIDVWQGINISNGDIKLIDPNNDGDLELAITATDLSAGEYIQSARAETPAAGLLGRSAPPLSDPTLEEPRSQFIYRDFYLRLQESDEKGPVELSGGDVNAMEDYALDAATIPWNNVREENADGEFPEDKDDSGELSDPRSSMVGQIYFSEPAAPGSALPPDYAFYMTGRGPGAPNDVTMFENWSAERGYIERGNNWSATPATYYTNTKWFLALKRAEFLLFYYLATETETGVAFLLFNNDAFDYDVGDPESTAGTFGLVSPWNQTGSAERAIDNVRIIPARPINGSDTELYPLDYGTYTSKTYDSASLPGITEWGWVSFNRHSSETWQSEPFYQFGTQIAEQTPPPTQNNYSRVAVEVNGVATGGTLNTVNREFEYAQSLGFLGSANSVNYQVLLLMSCTEPGEINIDQPIFEDITMTYIVEPQIFHYRRK